MPEITRRSSTRGAPGRPYGRCGSIAAQASSLNQYISLMRRLHRNEPDRIRKQHYAQDVDRVLTLVLSAVRDGEGLAVDSRRIGAPLIFERLWRETGCKAVVEALLADRRFEFPVERAIFASVLHGCAFRAQTAAATGGSTATASPTSTASTCTICTGRSPGWARNWLTRMDGPGRRAAPRT